MARPILVFFHRPGSNLKTSVIFENFLPLMAQEINEKYDSPRD